jgi:hypothetical protein
MLGSCGWQSDPLRNPLLFDPTFVVDLFTKTTRARREHLQLEATQRRSAPGSTSTTSHNHIGAHMNGMNRSDYQIAQPQHTPTMEAPNSTIVDALERTAYRAQFLSSPTGVTTRILRSTNSIHPRKRS